MSVTLDFSNQNNNNNISSRKEPNKITGVVKRTLERSLARQDIWKNPNYYGSEKQFGPRDLRHSLLLENDSTPDTTPNTCEFSSNCNSYDPAPDFPNSNSRPAKNTNLAKSFGPRQLKSQTKNEKMKVNTAEQIQEPPKDYASVEASDTSPKSEEVCRDDRDDYGISNCGGGTITERVELTVEEKLRLNRQMELCSQLIEQQKSQTITSTSSSQAPTDSKWIAVGKQAIDDLASGRIFPEEMDEVNQHVKAIEAEYGCQNKEALIKQVLVAKRLNDAGAVDIKIYGKDLKLPGAVFALGNGKWAVHFTQEPLGKGNFKEAVSSVVVDFQTSKSNKAARAKLRYPGEATQDDLRSLQEELDIQKSLNHPNILALYYSKEYQGKSGHNFSIYLQFCDGTAEKKTKGMTLNQKLDIFSGISEGLNHMHQKGLVHGDGKPDNFFVIYDKTTDTWKGLVGDMGLAGKVGDPMKSSCKLNRAPEHSKAIVQSNQTGEGPILRTESDVWQFGVALYQATTEKDIPRIEKVPNITDIKSLLKDFPIEGKKGTILKKLISNCLNEDPSRRPTQAHVTATLNDVRKMK